MAARYQRFGQYLDCELMAEVRIPEAVVNRRRTRTYDTQRDNFANVLGLVRQAVPPPGSLMPTLAIEAPGGGWEMCDGRALSKADYPTLFSILGETYGATDDEFNLPDLRGRTVMGRGGGTGFELAALVGAASVNLTVDQLPAHGHDITDPGHTHDFSETTHTHTITDAGHVHTDQTAGSQEVASGTGATVAAFDAVGETSSAGSDLTIEPATIPDGSTGQATTGISVNDTGAGNPIDVIPPAVVVNWMIRT
jgi:microcystin-dependent protein